MRYAQSLDQLASLATGRSQPLFAADVEARRAEIADRLHGSRVLVVGGAGSIGFATVRSLVDFGLQAIHIVDQNENSLAESMRDLRNRRGNRVAGDLRALPLDFGSSIMQRFLAEQKPYDYVLNFAAIKHVRSEKDTFSLLHMLDTNVLKPARLLEWLQEKGGTKAYFCVSTDKAANPANLMGASKRLMEHVIFSAEVAPGFHAKTTSARFANVAFSDGSLLHSFLKRIQKRQPLAAPRGARRYFISLEEAGQICLLAAVCAPDRHLLIPRLEPARDLHGLDTIAAAFLRYHGLQPRYYEDEEVSRDNVESDLATGYYPLLLTPLDTCGEKIYEEFIGRGDRCIELGMKAMLGVPYRAPPAEGLSSLLAQLSELIAHPETAVTKQQIVEAISTVVVELQHIDSEKGLDARM